MLAVAFFKCIVPQTTGVWVENGRILEAGTMLQQTRPNAHEVLGFWMIPAALTLASLFLLATTAGIRTTLRLSRRVQTHIQI